METTNCHKNSISISSFCDPSRRCAMLIYKDKDIRQTKTRQDMKYQPWIWACKRWCVCACYFIPTIRNIMFWRSISFLNNEPSILPFDNKIGIHSNAKIFVIHFGNVFYVDSDFHIGCTFIFWQFKFDVICRYTNSSSFTIGTKSFSSGFGVTVGPVLAG